MLNRFFSLAAFVAGVLGLMAAAAAAAAAAVTSAPLETADLNGVRDLGPAPATVRVRIAVVMNYHHQSELDGLVEAQADPDSRLYHHFLTPAQFRAYFAPSAAEYGRVISSLQRAGFAITRTFPNNTLIDASAPAPLAARYFATDIHRVVSPDAGRTYANTRPAIVPAEIADVTRSVFGLDASHVFHPRPHSLPRGAPRPVRAPIRRNGEPLFGPDGGYGPQIFIDAYDLPAGAGTTGTGRTSGIDVPGDFLDSDLAALLSYFGVTRTGPTPARIAVDGGAPAFPGGDAPEATEDVQTLVSLAPGTALYVYEFPAYTPSYIVDTFNQVVGDDLVDTLNSSWIICERLFAHSLAESLDAIEEQGSAEGITFHASAGDDSAYQCGTKKPGVGVPGSTPHNVTLGGTTLAVDPTDGEETSEIGWGSPGDSGTGGGVSDVFKLPAYQKSVPNVIAGGRNEPDLAFDGDFSTGASTIFNGEFTGPSGGTSLSSPIFGAALAEINQLQNSRSGYFNVTLYKLWLSSGYGSGGSLYLRDITEGSIPPYYAQPGYDQMSGIGAMQVSNFASLLPR